MRSDPQAFLRYSQQRVIQGYSRVLATWPDMPEGERAAIEARLRDAQRQLAAFESPGSESGERAAA